MILRPPPDSSLPSNRPAKRLSNVMACVWFSVRVSVNVKGSCLDRSSTGEEVVIETDMDGWVSMAKVCARIFPLGKRYRVLSGIWGNCVGGRNGVASLRCVALFYQDYGNAGYVPANTRNFNKDSNVPVGDADQCRWFAQEYYWTVLCQKDYAAPKNNRDCLKCKEGEDNCTIM